MHDVGRQMASGRINAYDKCYLAEYARSHLILWPVSASIVVRDPSPKSLDTAVDQHVLPRLHHIGQTVSIFPYQRIAC